jgi:hypothetical protein
VIPLDRDGSTADALLTDLYLDAILAGRSMRGPGSDDHGRLAGQLDGPGESRLDPAVRAASERLRHDLVRVHPSFRFEERLATRLAEAAVGLRLPTAVGAEGHVVPFRTPPGHETLDVPGPDESRAMNVVHREAAAPLDPDRHDLSRPLLIGGALTSAALSIAGAALVAWRRTRPASPMARAARAVRDAAGSAASSVPFGSRRLD